MLSVVHFLAMMMFQHPPNGFEIGMKLEAVDKRNPILIRAATVSEVSEHSVLLHFDGWSEVYDYWVDDDCPDLHPVTWCQKTGHPLCPPISMFVSMISFVQWTSIFKCL